MTTAAASRRVLSGAGFGSLKAHLPPDTDELAIGLLGGSFDPAHAAHVEISETAIRQLGLARVWWLVTPGNPLKAASAATPLDERISAARRLVGSRRITVTGFERALGDPYTIATLSFLRRRRPHTRFVWLMGADCLAEFHRWRQWREIMSLMPIAVVDRPGWRFKALSSIAAKSFASARLPEQQAEPLSNLSSTAIRAGRMTPSGS